jgi:hypothetical protein
MPVKEEELEPKFKRGDDVLGNVNGEPARGKVHSYNAKTDTITLTRRGPSQYHSPSKQTIKGNIEQREVPAADFELLYRKPVKEAYS